MEQEKYYGWTNKPTWLVKIWIDNDESTIDRVQALVTQNKSLQPYEIGDKIKKYIGVNMIDEENLINGLCTDLLNYSFACVNFKEIAQVYLDDSN